MAATLNVTLNDNYRELEVQTDGHFTYKDGTRGRSGINCSANFTLHLIQMAWDSGCYFEDLADGFGEGLGTMGGDWSGIRDSSSEATRKMLQRAMQHIHDKLAN